MRKCFSSTLCSECPKRLTCPTVMRADKRKRRPMSLSASQGLMRKAAVLMAKRWYTCEELGVALYGSPKRGRSGRMSVMVRARRPINRMWAMGALVVRPNSRGVAEYTLLPGFEGVFG